MNLLAEGLSDWAAIGTFATVVIGAIVAGVVSLLKTNREGKQQDDNRADSTWRTAIERQDRIIDKQAEDHRVLMQNFNDCQKEHARTDERLKSVEERSKRCEEDRDSLRIRLNSLEETVGHS